MPDKHILGVATIEIPVTHVRESIEWYEEYLGTTTLHATDSAAMLGFQEGNPAVLPTLYLVKTSGTERLSFVNSSTDISHSVIDFYVPNLQAFHSFLSGNGVEVTELKVSPDSNGYGGFGFRDPSGNLFGATNIIHTGS